MKKLFFILTLLFALLISLKSQTTHNLEGGKVYGSISVGAKSDVTITSDPDNRAIITSLTQYKGELNFQPNIFIQNEKLLQYSEGPNGTICTFRDPNSKWYNDNLLNFSSCPGIRLNDPNTVSQGTYAITNNKLYMSNYDSVYYATSETGIHARDGENILIENVIIKGFNQRGIHIERYKNITIRNCLILYTGNDGIGANGENVTIENCTIINTHRNAVFVNADNSNIINNTFKNIAIWKGRGEHVLKDNGIYRDYYPGSGIRFLGDNSLIDGNTGVNIGYIGIGVWTSENVTVQNNRIHNACLILDDGGGLYTWSDKGTGYQNNNLLFQNNHISNVIGTTWSLEGTSEDRPDASGIYIDDRVNGVIVRNNIVENTTRGLFVHNASNVDVTNNEFRDGKYGMLFRNNRSDIDIKGGLITGNIVESENWSLYIWSQTPENKIWANNTFDNNIYTSNEFWIDAESWERHISFSQWQNDYSQDLNSKLGKLDDTVITEPEPDPDPQPDPEICDSINVINRIIYDTVIVYRYDTIRITDSVQNNFNFEITGGTRYFIYDKNGNKYGTFRRTDVKSVEVILKELHGLYPKINEWEIVRDKMKVKF